MRCTQLTVWSCGVVLAAMAGFVSAAPVAETKPYAETLTAAGAAVNIDPARGVVRSILLNGQEEMAKPHPNGSEAPFAFLQVVDLLDHKTYDPLTTSFRIMRWDVIKREGGPEVNFTQQYDGAPFTIDQTFRQTPQGLRWEARLRLLEDRKDSRSLQVNWVLPLPGLWWFWGPTSCEAHQTDGVAPYRYLYGHTDWGPLCTILPLVGVWGEKAGAAIFSPPDVRKCQISFETYTPSGLDVAVGVYRQVEDMQMLRVAHQMIGLRPGKDLVLAIAIAGTRPDWRGVLGHYVSSYPDLFEPIPQARKYEGLYALTTPMAWVAEEGEMNWDHLLEVAATVAEVHGHFLEYGYYLTPDLLEDPDKPFVGEGVAQNRMTLAENRRAVNQMKMVGVAPFIYFYNVHAPDKLLADRFPGETCLDEQGRSMPAWLKQATIQGPRDSAFGRNLLAQLDLLLKAYPNAPGFFLDNFMHQKADFAHDDGTMMVHNKPCYDLNRNHQELGAECLQILHKAGKVTMVNKLATIESAKDVDMVLVEGTDAQGLALHAFACVNRALYPLNWKHPDKKYRCERGLQSCLIWGCLPSTELARDLETCKAYRPLTDALIGKRWVFDPNPLTLPPDYQGQVFRIDANAPHAGDVVVTVVDLTKSWRKVVPVTDLTLTVRLPEAEQLTKVTWLSAEKSAKQPRDCGFTRDGQTITVKLPAVGAAGVLRLSRTTTNW